MLGHHVQHLTGIIRFNLGLQPVLPAAPIWVLVGGFVLCAALLVLRVLYLGRRPPDGQAG